jgi:hypothetical protein
MNKKILGIFIGMLFIASVVPAVSSQSSTTTPKIQHSNQPMARGSWIESQKLLAADGASSDYFGYSVSVSGDTALISAMGAGDYQGAAYVFIRNGTTWSQQAKLVTADGESYDYFGYSVSLSGDTALIGALGVDSSKGAAYVFTRTGTTWTQQAILMASDGVSGDNFGWSVFLSGDNALIGALGVNGAKGAGYVFIRSGSTWTEQAKLLATDGQPFDNLGSSVSISDDTAILGAPSAQTSKGTAYVFIRGGTTWSQQAKLLATDGDTNHYFGCSVSISGDTAFVGASGASSNDGSAYVFTRSGTTWTQKSELVAMDGASGDGFGCAVSLSGTSALIGSLGDDGAQGSAYVFNLTGTTWVQQEKLVASDPSPSKLFGNSVSLSDVTALIGAEGDSAQKGAAYLFTHELPPTPPIIQGPSSGKAKQHYNFTFMSTDPNDDLISYFIDWGDNSTSGWLGPYASGFIVTQSHTWAKKGTYAIKAKAKDTKGNESDWGTFSVTMPLSYPTPPVPFFAWLFTRFPHAFPVLRCLLGY